MSEQPNEPVELPPPGDAAFATLMDTLVADEAGETPPAGETPADDAAGAGTRPADQGGAAGAGAAKEGQGAVPPAEGDGAGGAAGGSAGVPGTDTPGEAAADAGAAGDTDAGGADAGPGAGDRPATWTVSAAELQPKIAELATQLEDRTLKAYQQTALDEVKEEHKQYFDALEKHPRMLVGVQVPAIGKEGMETLRDAQDAKDWQDAVKSLLVGEVRDRASKAMDESADFLATIHSSIELFQKNVDLVPGTKDFDVELANRFTKMAQPYELRVEGKLQGYSIPVQPLIEQLRAALVEERKAKPAAPAAAAAPAAPAKPAADPPQAGIPSKAGAGAEAEDFSTLFGTLGLPNLQI